MNKPALLCFASAVAGSLATITLLHLPPGAAIAQQQPIERLPGNPPEFSGRTTPLPVPERFSNRLDDDELTTEERVNVAVYESVNRSVVNIDTKTARNDNLFMIEIPGEGAGSGSVLDRQGHVLTNFHVVEGAREIQVTLHDGKNYEGRLIGKDEATDIAVLKINAPAEALYPVTLADSARLRVGQKVFAIGNPFGLERTLTTGIISSLNRTLPTRNNRALKSIIQIDAAINPGNSGGPLLDSRGRLIGMNTAIASATGQSAGVGFAIPSASINRVVPQLLQLGRVIRPDTGITRVLQTEQGLIIATMQPGGPAERAGLRGFRLVKQRKVKGPFVYETETIDRTQADMIVAVDGEKITTAADFLGLVDAKHPGQQVTLTIIREGQTLQVPLQLATAE